MRAFKILICVSLFYALSVSGSDKTPPQLILANSYQPGIDIHKYWVSEKLDGVRAYWDGQTLVTRQGNIIHAPGWFLAQLPASVLLDGELWLERGRFEELSGIVRRKVPEDAAWSSVSYRIFDMPGVKLDFTQRLLRMQHMFNNTAHNNVKVVVQFRVDSDAELMGLLQEYTRQGAEGLMLHLGTSYYRPGRSDDLLKLKTYEDAEARVIQYIPGKGKYTGLMGSLLVKDATGLSFHIGSGFTDAERRRPPPIGSIITYKYYGRTKNGIPRFASFMRIRKMQ